MESYVAVVGSGMMGSGIAAMSTPRQAVWLISVL